MANGESGSSSTSTNSSPLSCDEEIPDLSSSSDEETEKPEQVSVKVEPLTE